MLPNIGPMELLFLAVLFLLLFGKRMPSVMRSLGGSITEFKKGVRGVEEFAAETNQELREASRKIAQPMETPKRG